MDCIESLDELIETLKKNGPDNYVKVAKNMKLCKSQFQEYAHWGPEGYTRNCIERNEVFELILICWNPGVCTSVHGHSNQRCWVYQIEGQMTEVRYRPDENGELVECNRLELTPERLVYMDDHMGYHALCNTNGERAMSLHLYASPIDTCKVFDEDNEGFRQKTLHYHSYKGKIVTTDPVLK